MKTSRHEFGGVVKLTATAGILASLLLLLAGCETPEGTAAAGHVFNANATLASNPQQAAAWGLLGAIAGTSAQMAHEKEVAEAGRTQITVNNNSAQAAAQKGGQKTYALRGGDTCTGSVNKDGEWDGYCVYTWTDGRRYSGQFRRGKRDGRGTQTSTDGTRLDGQWRDDKFASGTASYPDGRTYEGEFAYEVFEGRGRLTWADGQSYIGEFEGGRRHGTGTMKYSDGSE